MHDADDVSADVLHCPVSHALLNEFPYVFILVNSDDLQKIRIVVLEIKAVERIGPVKPFLKLCIYPDPEKRFQTFKVLSPVRLIDTKCECTLTDFAQK